MLRATVCTSFVLMLAFCIGCGGGDKVTVDADAGRSSVDSPGVGGGGGGGGGGGAEAGAGLDDGMAMDPAMFGGAFPGTEEEPAADDGMAGMAEKEDDASYFIFRQLERSPSRTEYEYE